MAEPRVPRDEIEGKGRLPAFFQDGTLHSFDTAVGLGSSGPDEAMLDPQMAKGLLEVLTSILAGIVGHHHL